MVKTQLSHDYKLASSMDMLFFYSECLSYSHYCHPLYEGIAFIIDLIILAKLFILGIYIFVLFHKYKA
jgi:hypothetical protein